MTDVDVVGMAELEAALDLLQAAPRDAGVVTMIVRRPESGERELLEAADLDPLVGLVGDNWKARGSKSTPDGQAHPEKQITVMNARVAALLGGPDPARQALAGDQLYVDLDIGEENLPAGSLLRVGTAVLKISESPHTGCGKFRARFGPDALRFVNSPLGTALRFRGLNAWVVTAGVVRLGDAAVPERS